MYGFKNGSPFSKQHLGSRALDSSQLTISRDVLHKQNTMPEGDAPQEGNQQITKNDLQNMLANLLEKANENTKRMLDDRIPEEKSEKRRKLEKVKLTSKANQQQFDYQGQVVDIFEKAENSLQKQKYDEVSDLLTKGKDICFARMKVLMIADRDGWGIANAYQSDDLASDEDDEKRIQKALREAARKRRLKESNSAHNSNIASPISVVTIWIVDQDKNQKSPLRN
eukprot:TCONS_00051651-protein